MDPFIYTDVCVRTHVQISFTVCMFTVYNMYQDDGKHHSGANKHVNHPTQAQYFGP